MGTSSYSKAPSSSQTATTPTRSETPPASASSQVGGAARYGNAAAQEALATQEEQRLMGREWVIEDYEPSTGGGRFDLTWIPATGTLLLTSRLAFEFCGTPQKGARWAESGGGDFDPCEGAWQPGETERWKADAIAEIEAAWSTDVTFRLPDLPKVPPARISVRVEEVPPEDAHFTVVVQKVPEDRTETFRDNIDYESGEVEMYESAADGVSEADTDRNEIARPYDPAHASVAAMSRKPVLFAARSSALEAGDASRVGQLSRVLGQSGRPRFPFDLWGYATGEEGSPEEQDTLAANRIEAVAAALRSESPETRVTPVVRGGHDGDTGPEGRRVDLLPQSVVAPSTTVAHEFGHVIGLPDEYDEEDGDYDRPAGDSDLGYPDRANEIAGRTLTATRDQSIMSVGDEVRPHHYVTILEALERMTGTEGRWLVGR